MRLQCPNCSARYQVPDSAIPPTGRSVQCSACGTSWTQPGLLPLEDPEPALPMRERPAEDGGWSVLGPDPAPPPAEAPADSGTRAPSGRDPLDLAVAAALAAELGRGLERPVPRDAPPQDQPPAGIAPTGPEPAAPEDAEHETALPPLPDGARRAHEREDALIRSLQSRLSERERRAEATAVAAISTLLSRQEAAQEAGPRRPERPHAEPPRSAPPAPPRSLPVRVAPAEPEAAGRAAGTQGRFALGLAIPLTIFGLALLLYVLHEPVGTLAPGAAPALGSYVEGIDTARAALQDGWQTAVASVRELAGR
ncbi:zinc-ribbon domain-containing protein [Oceanicella sp. SM1341]|uniref:zinc-ribbon domain-containing protein n=1 Tax=Oceanicella sp. SM1341 TaxID=1548889 RepID=UPI0018E50B45|nr:zinc-ribbon domain-containing protein [Oceanicella sp. SM1341]